MNQTNETRMLTINEAYRACTGIIKMATQQGMHKKGISIAPVTNVNHHEYNGISILHMLNFF